MLTVGDFAIPQIPSQGDSHADKIHLSVGRALHSWEVVEHHLGDLFGVVLGSSFPVAALSAYASGTSFNARKDMLLHASKTLFHWKNNTTLQRKLESLIKVCVEASVRRNEIAHGYVVQSFGNKKAGFFLEPSFHSLRKRGANREPRYAYTSDKIETFRAKFQILLSEIYELHNEILSWHQSLSKK